MLKTSRHRHPQSGKDEFGVEQIFSVGIFSELSMDHPRYHPLATNVAFNFFLLSN